MLIVTEQKWKIIENWLSSNFRGFRKDGSSEAMHSIRIGRALKKLGEDDITVFGGYFHDVIEDIPGQDELSVRIIALSIFADSYSAECAAALVVECSYSNDEYAMSKANRKTAACARWISTNNLRVAAVKIEDVRDNKGTASGVPPPFEQDYLAWAEPLMATLENIVALRRLVPFSP